MFIGLSLGGKVALKATHQLAAMQKAPEAAWGGAHPELPPPREGVAESEGPPMPLPRQVCGLRGMCGERGGAGCVPYRGSLHICPPMQRPGL